MGVIKISLEKITEEAIASNEYAKLRKQYLKEANKFYKKNLRKADKFKHLEYFGAAIMAAGVYGATQIKNWWFSLICGSPGAVMIGRSILYRRHLRKRIMASLEKETVNLSYQDLEKRLNDNNYEILEPDEKQIQQATIDNYADEIINHVMNKEHSLSNRSYTLAGLPIILGGVYISSKGSPYLGGLIALFGAVVGAVSEAKGLIKKRKLKKDVKRIVNEKGYDFFKIHYSLRNPYDFYQRHILPEIESQKQKD